MRLKELVIYVANRRYIQKNEAKHGLFLEKEDWLYSSSFSVPRYSSRNITVLGINVVHRIHRLFVTLFTSRHVYNVPRATVPALRQRTHKPNL